MITIENLTVNYGENNVLKNLGLSVPSSSIHGLVGLNGSGKTTLLNIISTIDKPTSGVVTIGQEDIAKMNEDKLASFRRDKLGFIFQDFNLLDTLTLKENVVLPLALAKVNLKDIEKRANIIGATLGIKDIFNKYPYEVSGGQKQRAAAARAIITKPKLILADEPTGALDSKSSAELLQALSDLNENEKATIMMVTHDAFAASYCKRIIFIKDGSLFTEIVKGTTSRKEFFKKILDVLSALGGNLDEITQ